MKPGRPTTLRTWGGTCWCRLRPIPVTGGQPIAGVGHGVVAEFTTAGSLSASWSGAVR